MNITKLETKTFERLRNVILPCLRRHCTRGFARGASCAERLRVAALRTRQPAPVLRSRHPSHASRRVPRERVQLRPRGRDGARRGAPRRTSPRRRTRQLSAGPLRAARSCSHAFRYCKNSQYNTCIYSYVCYCMYALSLSFIVSSVQSIKQTYKLIYRYAIDRGFYCMGILGGIRAAEFFHSATGD